ncbi:MAG TPA: ABC transporter permease [Candidatus Acidoferrales bacterium]
MNWLKQLTSRQKQYSELSEEIREHLDEKTEELIATGMSRQDAAAAARREFGNVSLIEEDSRSVWRWASVEQFLSDVRFGFRILRKNSGFAAVAILTLALGIGANTAMFSVVYGALLSPLPYPNPDQLVMVWSKTNGHRNSVSAGDFLEWKRQNSAFQDLVAWSGGSFSLSIAGRPEIIHARITSPGFFSMQGIPLSLGRDFLPEEANVGANHVAIMTHSLWLDRFGGDPRIIGQQIRLNGESYTVVGILSAGMPDRFESYLFVPLAFTPEQINHDVRWLAVMGRLKTGVTLQQANADMDAVTRRIAGDFPASNKGWTASVEPLKNDFTSRDTIKDLWLLLGAVAFVLLIACVNVANLLLSRATMRQKEVAVRSSLGATRCQLFSQFLAESLALALIGGAVGIALAWILLRVIVVLLPPFSIPTEADIHLNLTVLLFSLAATLLAGILCGSAPAWQSSRCNLSDALKEGGRSDSAAGRHGLRKTLVVVEFALALALLAGAGLVIHSFWKLTRVDFGFRQDHVLTFFLPIQADRFSNPEQISAFYRRLLDRIEAVPGISSAAASTGLPILGSFGSVPFTIAGQPAGDAAARPGTGFSAVTPEYFRTFGIQITEGRGFSEQDVANGMPVAIVNETFAKKYFSGVDPLAQRVIVDQLIPGSPRAGSPIEWRVIGVSHDVRNGGIHDQGFSEIAVPFWQSPWPNAGVSLRTAGDPAGVRNTIAAVIQSVDSDLALDQVRTMDQIVHESLAGYRFATVLFAAFAAVALVLAAIGIYGVMSFAVAQRTHEIGLRMALGADSRHVLVLVLREGMLLALAGLVLGLGGAYFVGRTMNSVLYEASAIDPLAVGSVAAVLFLSAVVACYLPAHRAAQVDPMIALHHE